MRQLTKCETENLKILTQNSIALALIEPTETGLKKSIMDATGPVRSYLKNNGFHNYELQSQGTEHKILLDSVIYDYNSAIKTNASLYRPITKKGDPRIWVYGLTNYANPNDILGLICYDKKIHVINLTRLSIESLLVSSRMNPVKELILEINESVNSISNELLLKLKKIAIQGLIPSQIDADTSVGRTLETLLGIAINSSKKPDYKGIELKSFRNKKGNRKNLFAQVPDWSLSKFKSSEEILNAFGYSRGNDFKLYCTVSAITTNSQGLSLRVENDINRLFENSNNSKIGDFVVWTLDKLHERLIEKHKETFWVSADSVLINGKEHFRYKEVEHTRSPIISQFDILLEQGIITLDHLIKREVTGKVVEKGPLFKIKPNSLDLLFPPSLTYNLLN